MIYILTESELSTLLFFSGYETDPLSPFADIIKAEGNFSESIGILSELHLLSEQEHDYILTEEARLLAEIIFRPEAVACIGKRTEENSLYYLCKKESVWVIYTYSEDLNTHVLWSFLTADLLSAWLKENIFDSYTMDISSAENLDLDFSYDEWYVFLLTQLLFMKRQSILSYPLEEEDRCFDLNSLINPENIEYLISGLSDNLLHTEMIEKFSRQQGIEEIKPIILQLAKKNILTLKKDKLAYTDMAIEWLDNRLLVDTVYFNHRKPNSLGYTILFSLRRNGVTALYEVEHGVRLISSTNIPWDIYLK